MATYTHPAQPLTLTLTPVRTNGATGEPATRPADRNTNLYQAAKEDLDRRLAAEERYASRMVRDHVPSTRTVVAELKQNGVLVDRDEAHR